MGDRPANTEEELVITPEMIAAGMDAYYVFDSRDRSDVVVSAIYEAMFMASPSRLRHGVARHPDRP